MRIGLISGYHIIYSIISSPLSAVEFSSSGGGQPVNSEDSVIMGFVFALFQPCVCFSALCVLFEPIRANSVESAFKKPSLYI